jgi:hypothetical protein
VIRENRGIIQEEYSLQKNRDNLLRIYDKVLTVSVTHDIDKHVLLDAFNTPEKHSLLLCDRAYG